MEERGKVKGRGMCSLKKRGRWNEVDVCVIVGMKWSAKCSGEAKVVELNRKGSKRRDENE